jgi:hypothetical protein
MRRSLLLSVLFAFLSSVSLSQTNAASEKECRISTGFGLAGANGNLKSIGAAVWVQLDYKLLKNVSVATEFESMTYKQHGYFKNLPVTPNEITVYNNNFSLLLKYHLAVNKISVLFASGWTFSTRQNDYYIFTNQATSQGTTQEWFRNVTSFSDYRIPLLAEIEYPVTRTINLQARVKYNLNPQNGDTYSSALGASLKL